VREFAEACGVGVLVMKHGGGPSFMDTVTYSCIFSTVMTDPAILACPSQLLSPRSSGAKCTVLAQTHHSIHTMCQARCQHKGDTCSQAACAIDAHDVVCHSMQRVQQASQTAYSKQTDQLRQPPPEPQQRQQLPAPQQSLAVTATINAFTGPVVDHQTCAVNPKLSHLNT
jgi:hypothetical protein